MDEDGIANILVCYYQGLFTSSNLWRIGEVVVGIPCSILDEMNQSLNVEYTREDVVTALKQMEPLKAPSPNGLPPLFFQHYWQLVGDDMTEVVLSCLTSSVIPLSINQTFITLIPKLKSPLKVSEFCPICLCNIIYKLVSKVIANRLKRVLPLIISESQSAFQSNKAISDNILVAFETLHHMKNQKAKKGGFMALKLDMSKAYDRVEWSFLEATMVKMGFNEKWVALVMSCINSAFYSILVNGVPKGDIRPTRGIRQGDPLSLYLFLICFGALNCQLQLAAGSKAISGFSLCKNGPKITHLFFVDDTLLFCRATINDLDAIQRILSLYEQASGQKLHREKTFVFFSKSTPKGRKLEILDLFEVSEV